MHVVGVGYHYTATADIRGEGTEDWVEAEGEELSTQGVALACPTARVDNGGGLAVSAHVQVSGAAVAGVHPLPEAWEGLGDDGEEGATMNGVESVGEVQR